VYASLVDLESWYEALRAGWVLESATLRLASRPVTLADGNPTPYGMGWLAEFADGGPLKDKRYVFAFGGLLGFRSVFQWYQEEDVLLVWLANGGSDAVLEGMRSVPELLITGFDEATLGGE
jgi:CubicO group peptidase (beta-lactamase class C family)